jgi:hypothetical protein
MIAKNMVDGIDSMTVYMNPFLIAVSRASKRGEATRRHKFFVNTVT